MVLLQVREELAYFRIATFSRKTPWEQLSAGAPICGSGLAREYNGAAPPPTPQHPQPTRSGHDLDLAFGRRLQMTRKRGAHLVLAVHQPHFAGQVAHARDEAGEIFLVGMG